MREDGLIRGCEIWPAGQQTHRRHNSEDFKQNQFGSDRVRWDQGIAGRVIPLRTRPDELMQTALGHGTEDSDVIAEVTQPQPTEVLYSLAEAARLLRMSLSSLRRNVLPYVVSERIGRKTLISSRELEAFREIHRVPGKAVMEGSDGRHRPGTNNRR